MLSDKEMLKITKGLLEIAENNKDKAFEEYSELISCMHYKDTYEMQKEDTLFYTLAALSVVALSATAVLAIPVPDLVKNMTRLLEDLKRIDLTFCLLCGAGIFGYACILGTVISSWKEVFKTKEHMKEHGVSSDVTVKDLSHLVDEKDISLRDCYSVINSLKSFMNDGKYEELFSKINESKGIYPVDFTNYVSELNKIWDEFLMEESTVYATDLTSSSRDIKRISLTSK